jgi:3-deoxy-7-phosphoheptulonate synthase
MIIVMQPDVSKDLIDSVINRLKGYGFDIHLSQGVQRTIIGAIGNKTPELIEQIESFQGVEKILPILQPFKLASIEFKGERTKVEAAGVCFGGEKIPIIGGPCAVESEEQIIQTAMAVKEAGASLLRGGAYKPRTSPYSFQGLAEDGLKLLKKASEVTGLGVVTEVIDPQDVEKVCQYASILQIGARNMQNFNLLKEVGSFRQPVILKRGLAATVSEWLQAADYIISKGNEKVILCERGIRTFETQTRNTLDLSSVVAAHELSHLPVIVDPSHGTGKRRYIPAMSKAAIAAGVDGLMIEVHYKPEQALSDGPQSLCPEEFKELVDSLKGVAQAMGRYV